MIFTLAGEGPTDIAAATRLVEHAGHSVHRVFPSSGKSHLDRRLGGYNNAARFSPWLVLRDLDRDAPCAPILVDRLLPNRAEHMLFRIAVRSLESWLLADEVRFSNFFKVPRRAIPPQPDVLLLVDSKQALLDVIANASNSAIGKLMLPGDRTRKVGPGYSTLLIDFISAHWNIDSAATRSPSLDRCVRALASLTD